MLVNRQLVFLARSPQKSLTVEQTNNLEVELQKSY